MSSKKLMVLGLALTGALTAGLAQARGNDDVQWSVTIGAPLGAFVYEPRYPVYTQPARTYQRQHYQQATRWDRDGDGIPNRYDAIYNPRWDRDGDGIPNRYDATYNPRWDRDGDGIPNRYDRQDSLRRDRDGDSTPHWQGQPYGADGRAWSR